MDSPPQGLVHVGPVCGLRPVGFLVCLVIVCVRGDTWRFWGGGRGVDFGRGGAVVAPTAERRVLLLRCGLNRESGMFLFLLHRVRTFSEAAVARIGSSVVVAALTGASHPANSIRWCQERFFLNF